MPIRPSIALSLAVLALLGCSSPDDAVQAPRPPAMSRATTCDLLLGDEPFRTPGAIEYVGLEGSLRYVRSTVGVPIAADLLVFLQPEAADSLDAMADVLAGLPGVVVVETMDQDDVFVHFLANYGEGAGAAIAPRVLPPVVGVMAGSDAAQQAVLDLRDRPDVYDIIVRAEVAEGVHVSLRLVVGQFGDELARLAASGPLGVRRGATALLELERADPGAERLEQISAATTALIVYAESSC